MHHEEHDDLWELLGRARPARVSPFFSRNVLRAIREEQPAQAGCFAWLRSRWTVVAAAACSLVVAGFVLMPQPEPVDAVALLAEHLSASPDLSVISNLDELLAAEESSVWLDHSVY